MKTQKQNSRTAVAALFVLILIGAGLAAASSAQAGVNVKVRLATPVVTAALHSGGPAAGLHVQVRPNLRPVRITAFDKKVARQLARRTRYNERELLRLKGSGYSWARIGRLLDLPRSSVRNTLRAASLEMGRSQDRRSGRSEHRGEHRGDDHRSHGPCNGGWSGTR